MANPITWTEEMDAIVRNYKSFHSLTAAGAAIGVSKSAVAKRAHELDVEVTAKPDSWTEEEINILRDRWAKNSSASTIANLIGKSRNAVLGKAHRLKLEYHGPIKSNRTPNFPKIPKPKPKRGRLSNTAEDMATKKKIPPRFYAEPKPLTGQPPIALGELTSCTCRAIVGNDQYGIAVYCGDTTFSGKPFCEGHCAMYYAPPNAKRA